MKSLRLVAAVIGAVLLTACGEGAAGAPSSAAGAPPAAVKASPSQGASAVGQSAASKPAAASQGQSGTVKMEWLGWSHYRFTSVTGKVILTNPFVNNPDSPVKVNDIAKADLILVPDGHGDEVGSAVDIAKNTGAQVMAPFELGGWLIEQGVPDKQVVRSNPGGRLRLEGITVRMVASDHGSGLSKPTAAIPYGGPAGGFMITFENGWTVYHAGSTPAKSEQALWADMYKPDAAIVVMNGDKEPMDFAMEVKLLQTNNPNLKTVFPHHHRVSPPQGATTVPEVQAAIQTMGLGIQVTNPVLSQVYQFSK